MTLQVGTVVRFKNGRLGIVGHINVLGGVCDDCCEEVEAFEVMPPVTLVACSTCTGTGWTDRTRNDGSTYQWECEQCGGTGKLPEWFAALLVHDASN